MEDTFPSTLSVAISSLSTGYCEIEALGGPYMISEFAEQISWLATVLRVSPLQGTVAVLSPRMTISPVETSYKQSPKEMSVTAELDFDVQDIQWTSTSAQGTCWTRLFANPILVSGYPILRKSTPATGLETSLSIMASIVQAHQIVRIENKIVMKGFNSLVVASAVDGGSILWHAFTSSKPEDRISYFDCRIEESISNKEESPLLRSLGDFRHIIGWCSEVTELCGHPQAELSISTSGAIPCPAYTAIDRVYVEGGFYVIGGVNARINQREQPVIFGETRNYSEVFEWVADQFVAFYDVTDRRGWLVDGASALLHLVRMSLQLEETKLESTYHWVFEKDKLEEDWTNFNGRAASIRTLKSWKNRALPLYIKNQTFSNGRPMNTYSTFGDRVDKVLHSLELLIEHQNRIATESGVKVSQTLDTRKGILGFDVLDLVKSRPQCVPRIERFSSGDTSWVSLLPAIGVLTIFGKGFGDLICPIYRVETVVAGAQIERDNPC
ncbi:hypothetical protein J4E91_000116 [Alternaria rosae]|nr:hypothetical protein J4E91_000116 [Alternaria rosae]